MTLPHKKKLAPGKVRDMQRIKKLSALPVCAPGDVGLDPKALEDHRGRSRWQLSMNLLPGLAECVVAQGRVPYLDLQGTADRERGTPVSPLTLFRCFSMTKPITAVGVMRLVELKQLALDDPVAKYIPSFRNVQVVRAECRDEWGPYTPEHLEPMQRPMTIRHLLTHTSGLAYGPDRTLLSEKLDASTPAEASYRPLVEAIDKGEINTLAKFCDAISALPLRFQPGTQYLYSHSIDVVGRVIEVVSKLPLDSYMRQFVLGPLGMTHTTFSISHGRVGNLAAMYKANKMEEPPSNSNDRDDESFEVQLERVDGKRPEDSAWYGRPRVLAGGGQMGSCRGGLVSCLRDVALFCHMLQSGGALVSGEPLLHRSTVRSLWCDWLRLRSVVGTRPRHSVTLPGWPYGWRIGWSPLGHIRHHDKCLYMGGWTTSWAIYPRWQIATITLCQSMVWFDVPHWDRKRDELDAVIEAMQTRARWRADWMRRAVRAAEPGSQLRRLRRRSFVNLGGGAAAGGKRRGRDDAVVAAAEALAAQRRRQRRCQDTKVHGDAAARVSRPRRAQQQGGHGKLARSLYEEDEEVEELTLRRHRAKRPWPP